MKLKQEKGITLVALIITIIVLLILAMVSIRLVMNGGIIDKSKNAVDKYSDEEIMEQIKLAYQEYQMSQYTDNPLTLQQAMDKAFGEGVATVSGDATNGWTVTVKGIAYPLSANGTVGEGVAVVASSWTKIDDETYTNGTQTLKVGDYVNYDPTAGATEEQMTYTSKAEKSGADSDQSFDARTYKNAGYRWQVLDVKDGKVRLISEEYVGPGEYNDQSRTTYYLTGQAGYINGIEELNKISSIFGHGKGAASATSITVEDINGITGYNPATAKYNEGYWNEYGNKVTYTREEGYALSSSATNGKSWSGSESTFKYYNGTSFVDLTGSITIESTGYSYVPAQVNSSFLTGETNQDGTLNTTSTYQMLFGGTAVGSDYGTRNFTSRNNQNFWLASNYVSTNDRYVEWDFCYVMNGRVDSIEFCSSAGFGGGVYKYGIRPIVSIKSSSNLEWNSTSNQWDIK